MEALAKGLVAQLCATFPQLDIFADFIWRVGGGQSWNVSAYWQPRLAPSVEASFCYLHCELGAHDVRLTCHSRQRDANLGDEYFSYFDTDLDALLAQRIRSHLQVPA